MLTVVRRFCHTKTIDSFGNYLYCFTNKRPDLKKIIADIPFGKALLVRNVCESVIDNIPEMKFQCVDKNGKNVYLVRNGSNCPELYDGKYYAGGVNIIVRKGGCYYTIFTKDKSRKYITCPGGTANEKDFFNANNFDDQLEITGKNIGIRELKEETTGVTKYGKMCAGLDLNKYVLSNVCQFEFKSKFFDIDDIQDIYTMNSYYFDLDSKRPTINRKMLDFFRLLFDKSNTIGYNYQLKFISHSEIDYVYAHKLVLTEILIDKTRPVDLMYHDNVDHPVTNLHLAASYHHLHNIFKANFVFTHHRLFTHIRKDNFFFDGFPKNLVDIKFY